MAACGVLGTVSLHGSPVSSARQRRVLAALAVARGAVVSNDRLVDVVWTGEPPPSPLNALQTYISRLRTALGPDAIALRPPGYALALTVDEVDAWKFEALVEQARGRPPAEALGLLDDALALWSGEAYAEFADADFARGEVVRLEELRASAALARLDALMELGRVDDVIVDTARLIDADTYRESVWDRRMQALHRAGRTVDAIRAFQQFRSMLADDLGLEPSSDLVALERALVGSTAPADQGPDHLSPGLVPDAGTTIRGRDVAIEDVSSLLVDHPVVTLVGPGGVGKTRLAIEVARAGATDAWVIELAAVSAERLAPTVCDTLGLRDEAESVERLRRVLSNRAALLVLDNCEHLAAAAAELVRSLVSYCPRLRVLATSRLRLGLANETVWDVRPLPVPTLSDVRGLDDLDGYAATRLFLDRAQSHAPIEDGPDSARAIAAICAAVDGLPLGIELSAATLRELPLARIVDGLTSSRGAPDSTTAGRHRSLDAAVAWSYELLEPDVRRVARRLGVFEGGWTVDAAATVGAGTDVEPGGVVRDLADLVAASFVTFDRLTGRYTMLETVRRFAVAQLAGAGDADDARDHHLAWVRGLAARAAPELAGPTAAAVVAALDAEQANVRAALRWALSNDRHAREAERLVGDLVVYWSIKGTSIEAVEWMRQVLEHPGPLNSERAALTLELSNHLSYMGAIAESAAACDDALHQARSLGDRALLGRCLVNAAFFSEVDEEAALAAEAQTIGEDLGNDELTAAAMHMQGLLAQRAGRYDEAVELYGRTLATAADPTHIRGTRYMLAAVCVYVGRWAEAEEQLIAFEAEQGAAGARGDAAQACALLAQIELARDNLDGARLAYGRAAIWGRPSDSYIGDQLLFDATGALVDVVAGNVSRAAEMAGRLAAVPADATGHGIVCPAWIIAGEVLFRAGDDAAARRCFIKVLRHRSGRFPHDRALALAGVATTLPRDTPVAVRADLAAVAADTIARHDIVPPPWLTTSLHMSTTGTPTISGDEAVALALEFDE